MVNWGYVAGFFDGEGNLQVHRGQRVRMYQKDPKPLERIAEWLKDRGIQCTVKCRKTPRITNFLVLNQESWLEIGSLPSIVLFCRSVLPYLCVKKTVVQDFLRFRTICPAMDLSSIGKLGRSKSGSVYGLGRHDKSKRDPATGRWAA